MRGHIAQRHERAGSERKKQERRDQLTRGHGGNCTAPRLSFSSAHDRACRARHRG
jgi:hypothetical protein